MTPKTRSARIAALSAVIFFGQLCAGIAMAIEETDYSVVYTSDRFEIRRYEPHIVAETLVEGDFEEVGNVGFRRLFDYISGENRSRESIEMTAPVTQAPQSEKIEMTAPVTQEGQDGRYRITFLMPSRFNMQTLPQPLDDKVRLKQVPGRWVAAIRYSGTWSRQRYEDHEEKLLQWVLEHDLQPEGDPVFARYNAPFIPWFLRRNEVLVPIQKPAEDVLKEMQEASSGAPQ